MAASSSSAARIAEALEAQGVPTTGQRQGGDLGVDVASRRHRRLGARKARQTHGCSQLNNIRKLLERIKGARSLHSTGGQPRLAWGYQGHGMGPTTFTLLRGRLAIGTGLTSKSVCINIVYALPPNDGLVVDPG
eukprot:9487390-Pyramimonas_sp.AAC.2